MRTRIHAHFTDLHHQRETIEAERAALASDNRHVNDIDLLDELPELAGRLDGLPEHLQAELFTAFDIQVVWNQPMNQVTFHATITDTTPGLVTELLTLTGGDPTSAETGPALAQAAATSSDTASGFTRLPMTRNVEHVVDDRDEGRRAAEEPTALTRALPLNEIDGRPDRVATLRVVLLQRGDVGLLAQEVDVQLPAETADREEAPDDEVCIEIERVAVVD
jgi:hypothetical protein